MAGLVVLGLLTVVAGVLSGRSTINYVLARDAREAALSWTGEIDTRLSQQGSAPSKVLDQDLKVVDAGHWRQEFAAQADKPATLPSNPTLKEDGHSLIEIFDRLTMGRGIGGEENEFVSKLDGFALLGADEKPLAIAGSISPATLQASLYQPAVRDAFARSIRQHTIEVAGLGGGDKSLTFVPVTQAGKVARVYAFAVDQSAAASITNIALTVVTLTTSLLMVLGFSVPAAIASADTRALARGGSDPLPRHA
jgi:hypothetical protein